MIVAVHRCYTAQQAAFDFDLGTSCPVASICMHESFVQCAHLPHRGKVQRRRAEVAEVDAGTTRLNASGWGIQRHVTKCQMDEWPAVPRLLAADMCTDCPTLTAQHEPARKEGQ